jgi:hypothetical protein
MAKKTVTPAHVPVNYVITVNVDKNGNFAYTLPDGTDAKTLTPTNGDTVQWILKVKGKSQSFSIEFPDFSPFGISLRVFRSFGGPTQRATVNVSSLFRGNLAMKYDVVLENGWSDDPDIVPIPADARLPGLALTNSPIKLSIDPQTGLVITPKDAVMTAGLVTWSWAGAPVDDFNVTFNPPVPGWQTSTSSNGTQQVTLNLAAAAGTNPYTVTTQNLGLSAPGTLAVH